MVFQHRVTDLSDDTALQLTAAAQNVLQKCLCLSPVMYESIDCTSMAQELIFFRGVTTNEEVSRALVSLHEPSKVLGGSEVRLLVLTKLGLN